MVKKLTAKTVDEDPTGWQWKKRDLISENIKNEKPRSPQKAERKLVITTCVAFS